MLTSIRPSEMTGSEQSCSSWYSIHKTIAWQGCCWLLLMANVHSPLDDITVSQGTGEEKSNVITACGRLRGNDKYSQRDTGSGSKVWEDLPQSPPTCNKDVLRYLAHYIPQHGNFSVLGNFRNLLVLRALQTKFLAHIIIQHNNFQKVLAIMKIFYSKILITFL